MSVVAPLPAACKAEISEKFVCEGTLKFRRHGLCGCLVRLVGCYWGAIRFVIRCGDVRGATGNESSELRINTSDFALICIGADCCAALRMD